MLIGKIPNLLKKKLGQKESIKKKCCKNKTGEYKEMIVFMQLLINSLIAGSIYALVATGFALIYSTARFVHFAHGVVVAGGAYFMYFFFSLLHIYWLLAILLTIACSAGLGLLLDYVFYKALRKRKASQAILLIASFALLILLENLILLIFGADVKTIALLPLSQGIQFIGARITPLQIIIIVVSLVLLVGLYFLMKKTKLGKAMRAVADNKEVAQLQGIAVEKIYRWSIFLGSALAGVAGILVGLEQHLEPTMGTGLIIKGFTGSVIGGIGSVPGAVIGSYLLGIVENFGIWYLPSGYKDAIAFVLLFLFLILRPQGLLGIRKRGDRK